MSSSIVQAQFRSGKMMKFGVSRLLTVAAGIALAGSAPAVFAQSLNDWQLPTAPASPQPRAAGPVDPDNPATVPPAPTTSSARPTPTAAPKASVTLPGPAPSQAPARSPARADRGAAPPAAPRPATRESAAAQPSAAPTFEPPAIVATTSPVPIPSPALPDATPVAPSNETPTAWYVAGALLIVALLGTTFLFRRRKPGQVDAEPVSERPPHPRPASPPRAPAAPPAPAAEAPLAHYGTLELELAPQRLLTALVNAIFAYRLTVRNSGTRPSAPVTIACDLISAHASLSPAEQLSMPAESLAPSHQVPSLAPGQSVELKGEMRLPMAAVRAVSAGSARLFVPLARFAVIDHGGDGPQQVATRIYVIGEGADQPGDKLRPFRIDQGPRTFSRIEQRPVAIPA